MDDQSFEVNLIEGLTSEHEELEYESDHEFDLESDDFNLDQIVDSTIEWAQMRPQSFSCKKNNS